MSSNAVAKQADRQVFKDQWQHKCTTNILFGKGDINLPDNELQPVKLGKREDNSLALTLPSGGVGDDELG